jgi:hypothetical protein
MRKTVPEPIMTGDEIRELVISELEKGMPGIPPECGKYLAQAASICLEDQEHTSGVELDVDGDFSEGFRLIWNATTDQMHRFWADPEVATEQGAYGIAALLISHFTGLTICERSRKGTGIDFWLGSDGDFLFQKKARLEVSGIRRGGEAEIRARLRQKKEQTRRSNGTALPAYVIIVEFGEPLSTVVKR